MKLLLLGGTADARHLCDTLLKQKIDVTYSIAGLVRTPDLACKVIVGGFSAIGGLTQYLADNQINLIIDATHPYAQKMSNQAVSSALESGIEVWRFHRPAWIANNKDQWLTYQDFDALLAHLKTFRRPMLSAGQFSFEALTSIQSLENIDLIVWRTAVAPKFSYEKLTKLQWLKAIGPFLYEDEEILIQTQDIDVIVSKNSGGRATSAKLQVAQKLGLKVLMLERPILLAPNRAFSSLEECADAIMQTAL
jgi:precorrin-6A/cobalt-precorrin-6A reductase